MIIQKNEEMENAKINFDNFKNKELIIKEKELGEMNDKLTLSLLDITNIYNKLCALFPDDEDKKKNTKLQPSTSFSDLVTKITEKIDKIEHIIEQSN